MNLKLRIQKELAKQKEIEGISMENESILLFLLDCLKTQQQWNSLVNCKFHKYGIYSYESYRFYYPSEELIKIVEIIKGE